MVSSNGSTPGGSARYTFKSSPYSSHGVLMNLFPSPGDGSRVLDVGCGDGHLAGLIALRGYRVVGLEKPQFATGFPATAKLVEADLDQGLPELDGGYDHVICADVLEHLRDPAALLRQLRGVVKPGGRLVASLPNSVNIYARLVVLSGRFPQEDRGLFDRTHLRFYDWRGWVDLLASAGFQIDRAYPTGMPIGLRFPDWQESFPIHCAEGLSYLLARMRKQLFAYQFVVTAKVAR